MQRGLITLQMNLRDNKILDYSAHYDQDNTVISVYVGHNGAGKTRVLQRQFEEHDTTFPKKILISDSFPTDSREFVKVLQSEGILDELQRKELTTDQLQTANLLLAGNYKKITYIPIYIPDIISENYDMNDIPQLFGKSLAFDSDNIRSCYYYFFELTSEDESQLTSLSLGVGERMLLCYLMLLSESNQFIYLDEPFNYLSVTSAYVLSKMMIYSAYTKCNQFFFSTNSLDVIDYLISFRMPLKMYLIKNTTQTKLTTKDFYYFFSDRYKFFHDDCPIIFVEDDLACQLLKKLIPNSRIHVLDGAGNLGMLKKVILALDNANTSIKDLIKRYIIVFDGDQLKDNQPDYVYYFPFDNVEDAILSLIKKKSIFQDISLICKDKINQVLLSYEKHDAYGKIKDILVKNDADMVSIVIEHHQDELEDLRNKILNNLL